MEHQCPTILFIAKLESVKSNCVSKCFIKVMLELFLFCSGATSQSVSHQVKLSNIQQQIASGKTVTTVTGNKGSLLTGQSGEFS